MRPNRNNKIALMANGNYNLHLFADRNAGGGAQRSGSGNSRRIKRKPGKTPINLN